MRKPLWSVASFALIALTLASRLTTAAEIKGTVTSVSGKTATVEIQGGQVPNSGDKAEIFFNLPGVGTKISVAHGTVSSVKGSSVELKIDSSTGAIAAKQLVTINSANAKAKSGGAAPVTPTPTATASENAGAVSEPEIPAIETETPAEATATPASSPVQPAATPASAGATSATTDPSFAFVDVNSVFKNYSHTKSAGAEIESKKQAAKAEYNQRADEYKRKLEQLNTLNRQIDKAAASDKGALTQDRDEQIAQIKALEREIKDWRTTREKQLQDEALEMRKGIVTEILAVVKQLTGDVNLVLDASGDSLNGIPFVLITPSEGRITSQVGAALDGQQSGAVSGARGVNIALVDMNRVFKYYKKTRDAEAAINAAKDAAKKEYDRRAEAYKKDLATYNGMSPGAARDALLVKIKKQEVDINEFRATREKQLQEDALKRRGAIVKELTAAVAAKCGANRCLIFDRSGSSLAGSPLLLYSSGVPDWSDDIIAAVNQGKANATNPNAAGASTSTLRFAVVDLDRASKALPERQQAEEEVKQLREQAKSELANADANAKTAKEKEIQELAKKKHDAIVSKIISQITQLATAGTYNIVLSSSGQSVNGVNVVVTSSGVSDLTDQVVAGLTSGAQ